MNSSLCKIFKTSSMIRNVTFRLLNSTSISNELECSKKTHSSQLNSQSAMFRNPCVDLQQYLDISLINKDIYFDPSIKAMQSALELFLPRGDGSIRRIMQTVNPEKFPAHETPELAFLGQSNAGKSTLLKAIFNKSPELRIQTSKNPGHTKSLKFYTVGSQLCLVDMPGYGLRQPKWFEPSVIPYLKNRKNLVKTFLLVDCTKNFHAWDDASLQMLKDLKIPFALVLTKIDLVRDSQRLKNYLHINNILKQFQLNTCFPQIFMVSAHTFEGLAYFLAFCAHITGNLDIKNS